MRSMKIAPQNVWGFNYHPSYASTLLESWLYFDEDVWKRELTLGKEYFPKMNTVRIWLSWDAWLRDPKRFADNFDKSLSICDELGLLTVPVLFNRWHDPVCDAGGIYLDQILPDKNSWFNRFGNPFTPFVKAIAGSHSNDNRILVWDLCNEPFCCDVSDSLAKLFIPYETEWLSQVYSALISCGVSQKIGIGAIQDKPIELVIPYCDILLTHLYFQGESDNRADVQKFEDTVEKMAAQAQSLGKEWICGECCWGSLDDDKRANGIAVTLKTLQKNRVGFMIYELYESGIADVHTDKNGPISPDIGMLHFINRDGSPRRNHDVANMY